jgi:hypothetical protein
MNNDRKRCRTYESMGARKDNVFGLTIMVAMIFLTGSFAVNLIIDPRFGPSIEEAVARSFAPSMAEASQAVAVS